MNLLNRLARPLTIIVTYTALVAFAACASAEWVQEGKTGAQTQGDYKECYAQTQQRYGTNLESPHFRADLDQCMESRGYRRK